MKKVFLILLAMLTLVSGLAFAEETVSYPWSDPTITESSDLPTWEGKQLELTWWYGHGVEAMAPESTFDDVIEPEIQRVTGVTINYDESFSNGAGTTFDVRLAMLAGTNDWPSIVTNAQMASALIEGGVVYDLTDLIPKYMPNLMKIAPIDDPLYASIWGDPQSVTGGTDRIYAIPVPSVSYTLSRDVYPLEGEVKQRFKDAYDRPINFRQSALVVRDDILKMIYPEAKTMDEIEALYEEKGYFDYEDVFDVPITTPEEFFDFLRKIDELGLTEGNQKVYATYASAGIDNYPLGARLASALYGWGSSSDCFTYWDNVDKTVKFAAYEEPLRNLYKTFNQLVREDVISPESLIDDSIAFQAKLNNGIYAVSYAEYCWPDNEIIESTKPYRYRPLYLDIPIDTERYVQTLSAPGPGNSIMIFKDSVAEEDLPQILMWADYHFSEAYSNMSFWGPESAGLFTEDENGLRSYNDEALARAMVYNDNPKLLMNYGLNNGMTNVNYKPRRLQFTSYLASRKYSPYLTYPDLVLDKANARSVFSSGMVDDYQGVVSQLPWIWNFSSVVPGVEKMWAARTTWEDALMKTLAAQSDEEFDRLYDEFIVTSQQLGITDETLAECTEYFVNTFNADYMDALK